MTLYIENDLIGQTEACMSTRDVWVYTSLKSLYTCSSNDIDRVAHEFIGENGRYHCGPLRLLVSQQIMPCIRRFVRHSINSPSDETNVGVPIVGLISCQLCAGRSSKDV